ncbi:MAG: TM2 domain-containing protein [Flavobacterium sp.]|nr:MAG: TM2 domain-containing protein [Flavobacterium sp.]
MKLKIIFSMMLLLLSMGTSYASFPVQRAAASTETTVTNGDEVHLESPAASTTAGDDWVVALLLWFFLGGLAGHRWYLGSPVGWNILFILTLGGLGVWWIVDGIDIITQNYPGL